MARSEGELLDFYEDHLRDAVDYEAGRIVDALPPLNIRAIPGGGNGEG